MAFQNTLQARPCALESGHPWPSTVLESHDSHTVLTVKLSEKQTTNLVETGNQ